MLHVNALHVLIIGWLRYIWMKNILNFPYRFTKPNSRFKNGFLCLQNSESGFASAKNTFTLEKFSTITSINNLYNFDISKLVNVPSPLNIWGKYQTVLISNLF